MGVKAQVEFMLLWAKLVFIEVTGWCSVHVFLTLPGTDPGLGISFAVKVFFWGGAIT